MWSAFSGPSPVSTRAIEIAVAVDQPFDGEPDLLLRQPAHLEQTRLELFELLLKVPDALLRRGHQPNLPVM